MALQRPTPEPLSACAREKRVGVHSGALHRFRTYDHLLRRPSCSLLPVCCESFTDTVIKDSERHFPTLVLLVCHDDHAYAEGSRCTLFI